MVKFKYGTYILNNFEVLNEGEIEMENMEKVLKYQGYEKIQPGFYQTYNEVEKRVDAIMIEL